MQEFHVFVVLGSFFSFMWKMTVYEKSVLSHILVGEKITFCLTHELHPCLFGFSFVYSSKGLCRMLFLSGVRIVGHQPRYLVVKNDRTSFSPCIPNQVPSS